MNLLKLKQTRYLNTINRWHNKPIIQLTLEYDGSSRVVAPLVAFTSDLIQEQVDLFTQSASVIESVEKMLIGLLKWIGCPVSYSSHHAITSAANLYYVLVEYDQLETATALIECLFAVLESPMPASFAPLEETLYAIKAEYEDIRLGPSTKHIADAALRRSIPLRRLGTGSLLLLGYGIKQRKIQASLTDAVSAISDQIVQDKELTKQLLTGAGIPTPKGSVVLTEEQALSEAEDLGYPVAIKPLDANQGRGVFVNIQNTQDLLIAFKKAQAIRSQILVEQFVPGNDYRLLVVNHRLLAASQRIPPSVVGDGRRTVKQLIELVNSDPKRMDNHNGMLSKIVIDEIVLATLAQQGLSLDDVVASSKTVLLRQNGNLSTGSVARDVTDRVHPRIAEQAIMAAKLLNIDVCGIDVVCEDISLPLEEQNGCFIELNLAPGLRMHLAPTIGTPRLEIGDAIIDGLFPNQEQGLIPIIALTGTNGKTTCTRLISHLLQSLGHQVGMTCTDGIFFNQQCIETGDCSGPWSANLVLSHPQVDACVLETARGGLLRKGLGFEQAAVAVITNIGQGDHLGLEYLETAQDLAQVKQTVLKGLKTDGVAVLNADDDLVVSLGDLVAVEKIYFSSSANNSIINQHVKNGGRALYYDATNQQIVFISGDKCSYLTTSQIPFLSAEPALFQIVNLITALAAVWALNKDIALLNNAVEALPQARVLAPARYNYFEHQGRHFIADYAHNFDALKALHQAILHYSVSKKRVMLCSPGDRKDEHILEQMTFVGNHFDHVLLYQDGCQRGRSEEEIQSLLHQGLKQGQCVSSIESIRDESQAIRHLINTTQPGELCLFLLDDVANSLELLHELVG